MRLYNILRAVFGVITRLVCRYRVYGLERVPESGPLLIVANYLSWFDPMLFGVVLHRRVWFFTKSELFHWPIIGKACEVTEQIPVRRGRATVPLLKRGWSICKRGDRWVSFLKGRLSERGG